ncbi:hypothetical protein PENTCL1PPCAC_13606, partial [Pristionchus entomophagus]
GGSRVLIRIDDLYFNLAENQLCELLQLRSRLFSGISIDLFSLQVDQHITMVFVREFITNFKIHNLHFCVVSAIELENSLQIMAA